jgi:hypothetical protein
MLLSSRSLPTHHLSILCSCSSFHNIPSWSSRRSSRALSPTTYKAELKKNKNKSKQSNTGDASPRGAARTDGRRKPDKHNFRHLTWRTKKVRRPEHNFRHVTDGRRKSDDQNTTSVTLLTDEESQTTRTQLPSRYHQDEEIPTTRTQLPSRYHQDEEIPTTRTQLPSRYHQDEEIPTTRTQLPSPYTNTVFLISLIFYIALSRARTKGTYLLTRYGVPIKACAGYQPVLVRFRLLNAPAGYKAGITSHWYIYIRLAMLSSYQTGSGVKC